MINVNIKYIPDFGYPELELYVSESIIKTTKDWIRISPFLFSHKEIVSFYKVFSYSYKSCIYEYRYGFVFFYGVPASFARVLIPTIEHIIRYKFNKIKNTECFLVNGSKL